MRREMHQVGMTINQICEMTRNVTMLNALHACRGNHPLHNKDCWKNAWVLACQRHEITLAAVEFLRAKANQS